MRLLGENHIYKMCPELYVFFGVHHKLLSIRPWIYVFCSGRVVSHCYQCSKWIGHHSVGKIYFQTMSSNPIICIPVCQHLRLIVQASTAKIF